MTADGAATTTIESPWRNRAALLALVPLLAVLLTVAVLSPWYSNLDVDTMTHFMQVRAVAEGGSIGFTNGPVEGHPELTPRWLFPAHGRAWGTYPVVFSYLMAPAMKLGGFRGVIRAIWLLFAVCCTMTYALTYRLTRRPAVAVGAAYVLGLGTSLALWGSMLAPFIPVATFIVTATYAGHQTFAANDPRMAYRWALAAGVLSGFSIGTHLLWTLPWIGFAAVFAIARGAAGSRLVRVGLYLLGSAPSLLLMAWVNHQRFGSWNPSSYGPCGIYGCLDHSQQNNPSQGGVGFVRAYAPLAPYFLAWMAAAWTVRRSRRDLFVVGMVGVCAALIPDTETRDKIVKLFRCLWGYLVDTGNLSTGFPKFDHGLGTYNDFWLYSGPWCLRAFLQCSPVLVAAFVALTDPPPGEEKRFGAARVTWALMALSCAGVLTAIVMRADLPGAMSIGLSFVNHRYLTPILPAAVVLAALAVARLPWRAWHVVIMLALGFGVGAWLASQTNDHDLVRRKLTLWGPLALALALWAALVVARRGGAVVQHTAALLASLAIGYGGAVAYGVDRMVAVHLRGHQDARVAELARCTPQRFVLLGGYALDETLVLLDQRQIYFINPGMNPPGDGARALLEQAMRDEPGRPAFVIQDTPEGPWHFYWPGFEFRPMPGCPRVLRAVRTGP